MDRREFTKIMGAVAAGMAAGSRVFGEEKKAEEKKGDKHICKGHNECKGKGGCAVPVKHVEEKKDKSSCKGKSGCKAA